MKINSKQIQKPVNFNMKKAVRGKSASQVKDNVVLGSSNNYDTGIADIGKQLKAMDSGMTGKETAVMGGAIAISTGLGMVGGLVPGVPGAIIGGVTGAFAGITLGSLGSLLYDAAHKNSTPVHPDSSAMVSTAIALPASIIAGVVSGFAPSPITGGVGGALAGAYFGLLANSLAN